MKPSLVATTLLAGLAVGLLGRPPAVSAQAVSYRQASPTDLDDKPNPTYPEPRGQFIRGVDVIVLVGVLLLAGLIIHHRPGGSDRTGARARRKLPLFLAWGGGALLGAAGGLWVVLRWRHFHWLELVLLLGAAGLLGAIAALLNRRADRRYPLILLLVGAVVYFGFYRNGCVCPIGAIQNVTLSLIDSGYTISIVVTLIFLLPILAALFFGRIFCGGVCWLGAVQDLLHRVPVRVPMRLDKVLRWGRWVYLGLAIWFVVGGLVLFGLDLTVTREFVICKYDPFVNLFRAVNFQTLFSGHWARAFQFVGPWWMWVVTGVILSSALFIGRPYCRWFCPYGALLGLCSRPARKPVTVMPDVCIDCELCNDACPFSAIEAHAAVNATCVACNRCYMSCPMERMRLGLPVPEFVPGRADATAPPAAKPAPILPVERAPVRGRRIVPADDEVDASYVERLVSEFGGDHDAALPILQAVQARHNYLPHPVLERVCELTGLTMGELVGLATFYNQFRLAPIGQHLVKVCTGTACHVAGARRVSDGVRLYLGLEGDADTDAARRFTVQEVACVGCCSLAPVMQIDDVTFGHLNAETAPKAVEAFTPRSQKRSVEHEHVHAALDADGGLHKGVEP